MTAAPVGEKKDRRRGFTREEVLSNHTRKILKGFPGVKRREQTACTAIVGERKPDMDDPFLTDAKARQELEQRRREQEERWQRKQPAREALRNLYAAIPLALTAYGPDVVYGGLEPSRFRSAAAAILGFRQALVQSGIFEQVVFVAQRPNLMRSIEQRAMAIVVQLFQAEHEQQVFELFEKITASRPELQTETWRLVRDIADDIVSEGYYPLRNATPSDSLEALKQQLTETRERREREAEAARRQGALRQVCNENRLRFEQAIETVHSFPNEEREQGRKASREGFMRWAERWAALGQALCEIDSDGRMQEKLKIATEAEVPELACACRLFLLAGQGATKEQLADAVEAVHFDLWKALLWLPYVGEQLYPNLEPDSDGRIRCYEVPDHVALEDKRKADAAFGWQTLLVPRHETGRQMEPVEILNTGHELQDVSKESYDEEAVRPETQPWAASPAARREWHVGLQIPCPSCGSPAAALDVDDACPKCGKFMFRCRIVRHIPLGQGEPIVQRLGQPFWERIPPSHVRSGSNTLSRYVTLDQMALMVNRKKRTLENYKGHKKNPLPPPDIEGGGGKPDEWEWSEIRPWLERTFKRSLPEEYPHWTLTPNRT